MALATLADVNRVLGFTTGTDTARDAKVRAALAAIESWAEPKLKNMGREGSFVHTVFDVPEDATLWVPVRDAVVTLVRTFDSTEVFPGNEVGYELTDDGGVILRPITAFAPFEGARGERLGNVYSRVDIHYQTSGQVPRAVTEGIALLAAGHYSDPGVLGSLKSEKIGDYSYTTSEDQSADVPKFVTRGLWFLSDYFRKRRVSVM